MRQFIAHKVTQRATACAKQNSFNRNPAKVATFGNLQVHNGNQSMPAGLKKKSLPLQPRANIFFPFKCHTFSLLAQQNAALPPRAKDQPIRRLSTSASASSTGDECLFVSVRDAKTHGTCASAERPILDDVVVVVFVAVGPLGDEPVGDPVGHPLADDDVPVGQAVGHAVGQAVGHQLAQPDAAAPDGRAPVAAVGGGGPVAADVDLGHEGLDVEGLGAGGPAALSQLELGLKKGEKLVFKSSSFTLCLDNFFFDKTEPGLGYEQLQITYEKPTDKHHRSFGAMETWRD